MGLLVPAPRAWSHQRNYSGRPTTTWGTLLTGGASNTLGSKAELIASTEDETNMVRISFMESFVSATVTDQLCNIYVGAGGSEVPIIPNLLCGWASTSGQGSGPIVYEFPLRIARGTRISADMQGLIASDTVYIRIDLYGESNLQWVGTGVETLGALTATSRGTQVTPGAASEGSWTSIGTSTRLWQYVHPMLIGNTDTTLTGTMYGLDVGTGSALIDGLENFTFHGSGSEFFMAGQSGRYVSVPSGTALQARIQSHSGDVEAKSVCLYGVY